MPRGELGASAAFDAEGVLWAVFKEGQHVVARRSTDAGQTWADAKLDDQWGKFAWRRFKFDWEPRAAGKAILAGTLR